jgi:hypothetical protein
LAKDGIVLIDIRCLPSSRGITARYNGICLVNIYAPSGVEKRREREQFFNIDLPYLLPGGHMDFNLAGDFNLRAISLRCNGAKELQSCP